ncbi:UDP-N-acetylmuramoyl-L-alanine--D-glutamate ligase [Paludibacterium sp. THUN1379]|uniref:UDP-N-acetylmuramoyl-L-alanine--D-glutamate ligase n=1 Tax=Paludibacterium sp. THUN1379 TaxID=3112107 RepID=UPI0030D166CB
MNIANRHIMVVGLGDSGLATVRWLAAHGAIVSVADSRATPPNLDVLHRELPQVTVRAGAFDAQTFDGVELLVVSPGVALSTPAIAAYRARGGEVVGDIELFARAIAGSDARVIAISGSNGKSTVTTLVGHLCRHAGLDAEVAGNIGLPVLEALAQREASGKQPDVWVLELSSFQLETTTSLHADAATVLNISEDHLDRYNDLLDYAHAKTAVFNGRGVQVLNAEDPLVRAMVRPGHAIKWFALNDRVEYGLQQQEGQAWLCLDGQRSFDLAQLPLEGLHNAANALAALALCEGIGLARETLLAGLSSFRGLSHRVELVNEFDGIKFIDDSKGTNVGATVAALNGMTRPVVLIAGGDGKGQDFAPLAPACQRIVRKVMLIGRDADKIAAALSGSEIALQHFETLQDATRAACALAQPGDVVLLSPACASLDMFRNYAERAQVFIDTVRAVQSERGL